MNDVESNQVTFYYEKESSKNDIAIGGAAVDPVIPFFLESIVILGNHDNIVLACIRSTETNSLDSIDPSNSDMSENF